MAVCVKIKTGRCMGSSRDITIYDFANSTKQNARARKSYSRVDVEKCSDEDAMDEDPATTTVVNPERQPTEEEPILYSDYHIDIWYSIADHIRPEDVGRFALICRKTAEVAQSAKFWQHLYRRYYDRDVTEVPRRLQPECMWRLRGLRSCTVRALFYTYKPFIHRIAAAPFNDPHRVAGRRLMFSWSTKNKAGWNYYFKLKARLIPGSRVAKSARMQQLKESLEYLQDPYMNAEEGCQILIITTDTAHLLPQYHEQLRVKSLSQTLASGMSMAKYKVRLQMANYCGRIVDELVFVPVKQTRVLDWWNPEYYREDPTIDGGQQQQQEGDDGGGGDNEESAYWDD